MTECTCAVAVEPRRPGLGALPSAALIGLLFLAAPAAAQKPAEPGQITVGFEQRFRSDNWNNAIDMSDRTNDQRDQLRDRTRLWVSIPFTSTIEFQAGAAFENTQRRGAARRFDEVFFDLASVHFKKVFVEGLSLKVGRQDLIRGEGFVLLDGSPQDGPRSLYFNAVDLAYTSGKSKLEVMAILNPARDRFLPRWHDQCRVLQTWDENAIGAYYTRKHSVRTSAEAYYFLKKEVHDIRPRTHIQFQPDRHISTAGARVVHKIDARTELTVEHARQWGAQHGGAAIAGWGGYAWIKHTFDRRRKPYVKLGYWAMSGDDPQTSGRLEGWDPPFSQWPKWSTLYPYTLSKEVGLAYWANLHMSHAEAGFTPFRAATVSFLWYHMDSFHSFPGDPQTFGKGNTRGEDFQVRWDYSPNPSWKAEVLYESFRPGDFYASGRAPAHEVKAQITYQFLWQPALGFAR